MVEIAVLSSSRFNNEEKSFDWSLKLPFDSLFSIDENWFVSVSEGIAFEIEGKNVDAVAAGICANG